MHTFAAVCVHMYADMVHRDSCPDIALCWRIQENTNGRHCQCIIVLLHACICMRTCCLVIIVQICCFMIACACTAKQPSEILTQNGRMVVRVCTGEQTCVSMAVWLGVYVDMPRVKMEACSSVCEYRHACMCTRGSYEHINPRWFQWRVLSINTSIVYYRMHTSTFHFSSSIRFGAHYADYALRELAYSNSETAPRPLPKVQYDSAK